MTIQLTYRRTSRLPLTTKAQKADAVERARTLLEPSHNARFHALMDRFFPQWRVARRETRRITKKDNQEA